MIYFKIKTFFNLNIQIEQVVSKSELQNGARWARHSEKFTLQMPVWLLFVDCSLQAVRTGLVKFVEFNLGQRFSMPD